MAMKNTSDTNFITDIASYGMLSAIDGKSKPMYLVYGDEVFRWSGPPEYMSPTVLTRVVHRDSFNNSLMDKIQKNMLVPLKLSESTKDTLRYTSFSNILECKYMREQAGCKNRKVNELRYRDSTVTICYSTSKESDCIAKTLRL